MRVPPAETKHDPAIPVHTPLGIPRRPWARSALHVSPVGLSQTTRRPLGQVAATRPARGGLPDEETTATEVSGLTEGFRRRDSGERVRGQSRRTDLERKIMYVRTVMGKKDCARTRHRDHRKAGGEAGSHNPLFLPSLIRLLFLLKFIFRNNHES